MEANSVVNQQKELFGHPMGLYVLFFTELWERFSYYGMRALLVLYLTAETVGTNPGWGWDNTRALSLYGYYTMLVYLASIPGGWLADNVLGQKKAVMVGGALLCLGHAILAIDAPWAFYTGLGFIIAGVGCLKPNISSMVGGLYGPKDERRDIGFTIFYMGINIGAFLAPLIVGWLSIAKGWHWGFGAAAVGMFVGQLMYMAGQKHIKHVGNFRKSKNDPTHQLPDKPLTSIEKDRIKVLLISFLLIIFFWGAFEQAGGLLNLYAQQKTDRTLGFSFLQEIPAAWFQSVNSFFIITLGGIVATYWYRRKIKGKEASSLFKIILGVGIQGLGFFFMVLAANEWTNSGSSHWIWLILFYLFSTIGELCASPVAMSFITKLAPLRYGSLIMGAYFAATGLGNKLAGSIGVWSQQLGEKQIFMSMGVLSLCIMVLVLLFLKYLKRLTHGAEDLAIKPSNYDEAEGFELADKS